MYQTALKTYAIARSFIADRKAELDEKALLITFFVLVAMVNLTAPGTAVSGNFCAPWPGKISRFSLGAG